MAKNKIKNEEENKRPSLREIAADKLNVSKEIVLDVAKIMLIGNRELTIENYKGIIEYGDNVIRLSANPHAIKISGKKLEIRTISQEMLFITGAIFNIEYVK